MPLQCRTFLGQPYAAPGTMPNMNSRAQGAIAGRQLDQRVHSNRGCPYTGAALLIDRRPETIRALIAHERTKESLVIVFSTLSRNASEAKQVGSVANCGVV